MCIIKDALRRKSADRLPISGKIRSGIKSPTKASAQNPVIMKYYQDFLDMKITIGEAELAIQKECGVKYPFRPENTPYFNIKAEDLEGGVQAAQKMIDLYGEDRGDGVKRIYRIPAVFPDMPKGIEDFFKSRFSVPVGVFKYESQYGEDGIRRCVYLKPVDPAEQAKRKKFISRPLVIRGECDPATCAEYGNAQCKFSGTLHFYVPGMSGSGFFQMKTGSAYASEDIFMRIEDLSQRLNGRLPKFTPDGEPVFYIVKRNKSMVHFDENGKETRNDQWVPGLETRIEMSKILMAEEQRKRRELAAPSASPSVNSVPGSWLAPSAGDQVVKPNEAHVERVEVEILDQHPTTVIPSIQPVKFAENINENIPRMDRLVEISENLDMGDELEIWSDAKYGSDWNQKDDLIEKVYAEVTRLMERRGPQGTKAFISLTGKLYQAKIPTKELAIPYLQSKFSGINTIENLVAADKHVAELLANGVEVAKTTMDAYLQKLQVVN